jgi:hypothetical protein
LKVGRGRVQFDVVRRALIVVVVLVVVGAGAFYLGTHLRSGPSGATPPTLAAPSEKDPFGAFFNVRFLDVEQRIRLARELGVRYLRSWSALVPAWNGTCSECEPVHAAGLQFVLTIRNSPDERTASSPVSDLGSFKRAVGEILDQYRPAVAVVENEENTPQYFSGSAQDYATELGAVCEVAHSKHIPCTNGGLLMASVTWVVYFHYLDSGQTALAQSYAKRGLQSFQQQRLAGPGGEQNGRQVAALTTGFLKRYKGAGADYLNIHWYGSDAQALQETVAYMKDLSGLPVITNEIGQRNLDPEVTTGLMSMVVRLRLPIAVWFSSDAILAKALNNQDGSLRPTGEAFRSFIQQHYE